tara:strand:- start:503 stop:712 length:210 start_codon:yes stop_codon:yes gene_type:complete
MYESGQGVAESKVRAYAWLRLASLLAVGEERVRYQGNKEQIEAQLTEAQLAEANSLSDRCLESRYRECE